MKTEDEQKPEEQKLEEQKSEEQKTSEETITVTTAPVITTPVITTPVVTTPIITASAKPSPHLIKELKLVSEFHFIDDDKLKIDHFKLMRFVSDTLNIYSVVDQNPCDYVQIIDGVIHKIKNERQIVRKILKYIRHKYPYELGGEFTREHLLHVIIRGAQTYFSHMKFAALKERKVEI